MQAAMLSAAALVVASIVALVWKLSRGADRGRLKEVSRLLRDWAPVTIVVDEALIRMRPDIDSAVERAMSFWNTEVGAMLFFHIPSSEVIALDIHRIARAGTVSMTLYPGRYDRGDGHSLATTHLDLREGVILDVQIYVDDIKLQALSLFDLERAIRHELGHVLGLDHDDIQSSVMYGKISQWPYGVTKRDKDLLRKAYA